MPLLFLLPFFISAAVYETSGTNKKAPLKRRLHALERMKGIEPSTFSLGSLYLACRGEIPNFLSPEIKP